MKRITATFAGVILMATGALQAQSSNARIQLNFDALQSRASESVNVSLGRGMLGLASVFLSDDDKDESTAKELIGTLDGIYVRSFTFDKDNSYTAADVESVRSQLGASWQKIVDVQSKDRENDEVYIDVEGRKTVGMVVIAVQPRELTIVNIVGPIDLQKLSQLRGDFGIPKLDIQQTPKPDAKP